MDAANKTHRRLQQGHAQRVKLAQALVHDPSC
jgi:ABC-type Na+ transport system ATPase subunit NatA